MPARRVLLSLDVTVGVAPPRLAERRAEAGEATYVVTPIEARRVAGDRIDPC
jgi:hypothetical protein